MPHERSNITASFAEHLKFQEKSTFTHALWLNSGKLEQKNQIQGTTHFEIAKYKVLRERSSNTNSFAEHLKFQEKVTFTHAFFINCGKSK